MSPVAINSHRNHKMIINPINQIVIYQFICDATNRNESPLYVQLNGTSEYPGTNISIASVTERDSFRWNILSDSIWQETKTYFHVSRELQIPSNSYWNYKGSISMRPCPNCSNLGCYEVETQKQVSTSWRIERDMWTSKTANLPGTNISIASANEWQFSIKYLIRFNLARDKNVF